LLAQEEWPPTIATRKVIPGRSSMTNYMIIRQPVSDLAQFQAAFDRMKPKREAAGLTDLGQFCAIDEPNTVIVVMKVADPARAREFWHSAELARGRSTAAIVGPVEAGTDQVWLTDGLARDRITKSD
jgi:hypothetical protein